MDEKTEEGPDLHGFEKRLKANLEKLDSLSAKNKKLILGYYNIYCRKEKLGIGRKEKVLGILRQICNRVNKDLDKLTEKDLEMLKAELSDFSQHTLKSYFSVLKTFVRWYAKHYNKTTYLKLLESDEWKLVNPYSKREHQLDPSDILTDKEFLNLLI